MKTAWMYIVLMALVFIATAVIAKETGKGKETNPVKDSTKPFLELTGLFQKGKGGYVMNHTPGVAVTAKGTVLVWCDARRVPSDFAWSDILLRRSTDNGRTFGEPIIIGHIEGTHPLNPIKTKPKLTNQLNYHNPVLIPDRNGAVHVVFCIEYCRTYYIRSDDDGISWSKPMEITSVLEKYREVMNWTLIATGPNRGIQLKNRRLVVPVWLADIPKWVAPRPSMLATLFSMELADTSGYS